MAGAGEAEIVVRFQHRGRHQAKAPGVFAAFFRVADLAGFGEFQFKGQVFPGTDGESSRSRGVGRGWKGCVAVLTFQKFEFLHLLLRDAVDQVACVIQRRVDGNGAVSKIHTLVEMHAGLDGYRTGDQVIPKPGDGLGQSGCHW